MSDRNDASWIELEKVVGGPERKGYIDLALFLGAGISMASKFPEWGTLVGRLAKSAKITKRQIKAMHSAGWSWPSIISLIRKRCDAKFVDDKEWIALVRKNLYKDFEKYLAINGVDYPDDANKRENSALVQVLDADNTTLKAIVELCTVNTGTKKNALWEPHLRVPAVLTYNVDALVQLYDRARHGSPRIFRTVERASKKRHYHKIPLYHLHGYLQLREKHASDEAGDALVLCEDEYDRRTDEAYNFATTTALWALREFVCVFIGCSMTDELARRVLYRSREERKIALRSELGRQPTNEDLFRHFAVLGRAKTGTPDDDMIKDDLELLGVRPLWVEDFGDKWELPSRLAKVRRWLDRPPPQNDRAGLRR